jgi:hypothetical protein
MYCRGAHISGVERVDSSVVGSFDMRDRLLLVQYPLLPFRRAVGHSAQDNLGDFETRFAQGDYTSSISDTFVPLNLDTFVP